MSYGDFTYSCTANGELQTKTHTITGEVTSYNYDVLGNLLSVILPDSTLIEYVIDAQNRRIGKKVNGTLVKGWLYQDSLNPIAELDGSGNIVSRFVYGSWPYCPDYMIKNGEAFRIVQDHTGSPRQVINVNNGQVGQSLEFDEYGNVLQDSSPAFQPFGFAGGLYDPDTGLVRFGARDYDSLTGRWTAKDPIKFGGGDENLFRFSLGDPINYFDPDGKSPLAYVSAAITVITTVIMILDIYQSGKKGAEAIEKAREIRKKMDEESECGIADTRDVFNEVAKTEEYQDAMETTIGTIVSSWF